MAAAEAEVATQEALGAFLKYYCLAHIINIRTTAYMRKAGVHTSTMPEASIGYF